MRIATEKSYARIGLIGNPSDGYGGQSLSVVCKNFSAEVTLTESDKLIIPTDQHEFDSVDAFLTHLQDDGYYGAMRLFKATLHAFIQYAVRKNPEAQLSPMFTLNYRTNIPRMVGLAGSSALVIAMLRALMNFYKIRIDPVVLPSLALNVEREELGIGGGLQDRVVQCYQGLVAMDFGAMQSIDGFECGKYRELAPALLPPLYIAYTFAESEPTEVFHNNLRARFEAGERQIVDAMQELADLTKRSVVAIEAGDYDLFDRLVNKNFDIRESISTLNQHHVTMVKTARACGVSAKYAGSGGAIVGSYRYESQLAQLKESMAQIGCEVLKPIVE